MLGRGGRRLARRARGLGRCRSGIVGVEYRRERRGRGRTKRMAPVSRKGFVVNHSHMKALVLPSLTEAMSPWMSLFTERDR